LLGPLLDFRVTDVVDVLLVTALVYALLAWLRRTQAARVATGLLILTAVYVAARAFDLRLTAWLFQGFFAIVVIIIVVIFQEELRQLFERVAVWSLRRPAMQASGDPCAVIVQGCADFARQRIGALIVFPGRQLIQRHVQGGTELDGRLSVPLLKSIFDPHSPGHDGAVIVENGRVTRFAAQLPLSRDFEKLPGVGMRHSAALGLAERTDALCCLVSEERGEVAFARHGQLHRLQSAQELGGVLRAFLDDGAPSSSRAGEFLAVLRGNLLEKVVALILVFGLWYLFVPGSRPAEVSYDVAVRVLNLPEDYDLEEISPAVVAVTLSGPARSFYLLDTSRLDVVVDASLARLGRRTFEISGDDVLHPETVSVTAVRPAKVKISLREREAPTAGEAEPPEDSG
jgi:uncharacterized protein (TIGR00159 family)